MPDLYNAQFTRFEGNGYRGLVPVHYIREWQYPKNASNGETAVFKTVRISEHRWPLPFTFRCNRNDVEWPEPPPDHRRLAALIATGLIVPWVYYPRNDEPFLMLDDIAENIHARDRETGRGELPDDYLEFWVDDNDGGEECSK